MLGALSWGRQRGQVVLGTTWPGDGHVATALVMLSKAHKVSGRAPVLRRLSLWVLVFASSGFGLRLQRMQPYLFQTGRWYDSLQTVSLSQPLERCLIGRHANGSA